MESETKNFHFIEMDLIVYFPKSGNKGKYLGYNVLLLDRKKVAAAPHQHVTLRKILETPRFEKSYPHTVGYYKDSSGEGVEFTPEYLEIRKIKCIEDFWLFLNALDI